MQLLHHYHRGSRFQRGYGLAGIQRFHGGGIGKGFFSGLLNNFVLPTLKRAGKHLAHRGVHHLSQLAHDALETGSFKQAAAKRLSRAQNELRSTLKQRLNDPGIPIPSPAPRGGGAKKKKKARQRRLGAPAATLRRKALL